MLVLTRKTEENVVIDDVITVKILKVQGHSVRLGIEAPKSVSIRRGELSPQAVAGICPSNSSASASSPTSSPTSANSLENQTQRLTLKAIVAGLS